MKKKCSLCNEKLPAMESCTCRTLRYGSDYVPRIRFGEEEYNWGTRRCPDCGVLSGSYHHENCTCEICPMCGELLNQCDCEGIYEK